MSIKMKIQELDALRGMAFLAVAMQHSLAHYSIVEGVRLEDGVLMAVVLLLAKFAVPVFIFITGMVLFYNYTGPLHYGTFLGKRAKDILAPYVLWSLVYFILSQDWQGFTLMQGQEFILKLFTGKNNYHLWYVVMICQFYLLFPLIRSMVSKLNRSFSVWVWLPVMLVLYLLLISQISSISLWMERLDIPVLTPMFTVYADRNVLYFFLYFVLGAYAGMNVDVWRSWMMRGRAIYTAVFVMMAGYYLYRIITSYQTPEGIQIVFYEVTLLRPGMAILLVSSIMLMYSYSQKLIEQGTSWWVNLCRLLGKYAYGAYLIHALMLWKLSYPLDDLFFVNQSVFVRALIAFVVCAAASLLLTMLLARLPLGKWTVGISAVKRSSVK